ncbi:MAG: OadG family protein, partial [Oscillospiraceae bacterium]|nr:OadG family protein [Oscillospiraceae bacterium]
MDWGLALSTTATGMIVVFSVLVILIVVVWTMGKIMDLFVNRPKKKKKKTAEPASVVTEEPTAVVAVET